TDTSVTVRYSGAERRLEIERGQAVFEVAPEANRPFRVIAGSAEVIVLGTQFDVYLQQGATLVTVLEGRVSVGPRPILSGLPGAASRLHARERIQVGAGQQVRVGPDEWPSNAAEADAQRATAWLRRQIAFEQEPLARVAAEFNRYIAVPIEIETPALRGLQI